MKLNMNWTIELISHRRQTFSSRRMNMNRNLLLFQVRIQISSVGAHGDHRLMRHRVEINWTGIGSIIDDGGWTIKAVTWTRLESVLPQPRQAHPVAAFLEREWFNFFPVVMDNLRKVFTSQQWRWNQSMFDQPFQRHERSNKRGGTQIA